MAEITSKPQEFGTDMDQPTTSGQQLTPGTEQPSTSTQERKERVTPFQCKCRDSAKVPKTDKCVDIPLQTCAAERSSEISLTHSRKPKEERKTNNICLLPPTDEKSESK